MNPGRRLHSFESLVLHCQLLAGQIAEAGPTPVSDLEPLVNLLPATATLHDRVIIRGLLSAVFGRVVSSTGIDRRAEATAALLCWAASNPTSDAWRADVVRLIHVLTPPSLDRSHCERASRDVRVRKALNFIAANYANPNITLEDVAAAATLSRRHAARVLKQSTGCGFTAHLRQRRISEARRLLKSTSLSVKEIAFTVGFSSSSQFGLAFKRLCRQAPLSFRRAQQDPSQGRLVGSRLGDMAASLTSAEHTSRAALSITG